MWKRLYPGETRGGDRTEQKCKNALLLEGFAKTKFKVGERYAKQALAILKQRNVTQRLKTSQVETGPLVWQPTPNH